MHIIQFDCIALHGGEFKKSNCGVLSVRDTGVCFFDCLSSEDALLRRMCCTFPRKTDLIGASSIRFAVNWVRECIAVFAEEFTLFDIVFTLVTLRIVAGD